ncbi:hypothetical protein [Robertmurraya kyonggiensis]|uniref:hypothetical protein n=1 Tax=Robertmurraya kyonggiensis TaxID=1037680 RepID=UPI00130EAEA3|nr:hypothetical protein [Robertmurraya kyonggiensis]
MSKVEMWKSKMDFYYKKVSTDRLKFDLETSGFKLNQDNNKSEQIKWISIIKE